jgi:hypothetical protein
MAYIGKQPSTKFSAAAKFDSFTGDGSTVTFDVANIIPAGGENGLQVYVNNVRQKPGTGNAYTIGNDGSGDLKRITFSEAPAGADEIYVITPYEATNIKEVGDGTVTNLKLANSAITGHTELTEVAADGDFLLIFDTSTGTLKKIQKSNIATTLTYAVNANLTGDGSTTAFTIGTSGRAQNNILVTVNGIVFHPGDDYTLSGTTLTFTVAPVSSAEIRVRYLPI